MYKLHFRSKIPIALFITFYCENINNFYLYIYPSLFMYKLHSKSKIPIALFIMLYCENIYPQIFID